MGYIRPDFPKMTSSSEKSSESVGKAWARQGEKKSREGWVGRRPQKRKREGWVGDDVIKKK